MSAITQPPDFADWPAEVRWDWLLQHGEPVCPWLWNRTAREQWERRQGATNETREDR